MGYLQGVSVRKTSPSLCALWPCDALCHLRLCRVPISKKTHTRCNLGPPSRQNCRLNKPLLFVKVPVCGVQIQQQKTKTPPSCLLLMCLFVCGAVGSPPSQSSLPAHSGLASLLTWKSPDVCYKHCQKPRGKNSRKANLQTHRSHSPEAPWLR